MLKAETTTFVVDTNKKDLKCDNNMADVLRGLQASLTKLATASEKQAAAIESLHDDIFLNIADPTVEDDEHVGSKNAASLDINTVAKVLAMTSVALSDKETLQDSAVPDSGPQSEFLESLTQALSQMYKNPHLLRARLLNRSTICQQGTFHQQRCRAGGEIPTTS